MSQIARGFLKDMPHKAALCNLPLAYNGERIKNVLENIEGIDGIYIYKNLESKGDGWKIGFDRYGGSPLAVAKAWDIAFTLSGATWTATATNCVYNRGGKTVSISPDLTLTMPAATQQYIGVKINNATGAATLVSGTTIANTVVATLPADTATDLYFLLFHASKPSADYDWFLDIDYRTQMVLPLYG